MTIYSLIQCPFSNDFYVFVYTNSLVEYYIDANQKLMNSKALLTTTVIFISDKFTDSSSNIFFALL